MGTAVLAARVVLAAVLVAASVGKLLDLPGSRRALADFGLPRWVSHPGGAVLPLTEAAAAVLLLVRPSAVAGAILSLALLIGFMAGIARALARGEEPDCHCFGRLHSAPAGRGQIARNLVLAAVAGFVVAKGPGPTINGWISARGATTVVAVIAAIALLALLTLTLNLWRERRQLQLSVRSLGDTVKALPPGLPIGSLAPRFSARGVDGARLTLDELCARGRPVALVFGVPGCGPCSALAPDLPRWEEALREDVTVAPVGIGTYLRYAEAAARTGLSPEEIYEADPELAREADELNAVLDAYRLKATPAAVIVSPQGTIASATVDGRPAIRALLRLAAQRRGAVGFTAGPRSVAA